MRTHVYVDDKTGEKHCTCFKRCGGCQLDMSYTDQLKWKMDKAERMLSKFCRVEPIIAMKDPYNYRNKVQTVFSYDHRRQLISGIYQSTSRRMVATEDCMLEDKVCTKAARVLKKVMLEYKIRPYDPKTNKGFIRHLLARYSRATGQLMMCICVQDTLSFPKKMIASELSRNLPELETVVLNVNNAPLPLSLSDNNIVLYGKGYIEDIILGKRFKISPRSFYQVNSVQTEKLYSEVIRAADLKPTDVVFDAYCGTGTIGILCADKAGQVIGSELVKDACADAKYNVEVNGLNNVEIINSDAGRFMASAARKKKHVDVVITDPPRAGCDKRFMRFLFKLAPSRVVYVSCKIESLEKDLRTLTGNGYKVTHIQPVDMFPHTTGIETVCLLEKQ